MNILETIRSGLAAIWANKIRSFLTMLGMIIGVSSVISLISIGKGVYQDVASLVMGMGTNLAFVVSGDIESMTQGSTQTGFSNPANFIKGDILKYEDIKNIRQMEEIEKAGAINMVSGVLYHPQEDKKAAPIILGIEPNMQDTFQNVSLKTGRYFTADDEHKKAALLSKVPSNLLFGDESDPVGKKVLLNQDEFEVVGLLHQPKKEANIISSDFDNLAIIPFTTANDLAGEEQIFRILVKIKAPYNTQETAAKIKDKLLETHSADEISVLTQEDMLDLMGDILGIMTTLISAIAAISLIVGGVGIMNIMLVSVSERTREIGIRKAIGATDGEILKQFLIEALMITLIGGGIGVALAYGAGWAFEAQTKISAVMDWQTIVLAVGISIGIGIIFGLFPALRAAKKDPVEALRYE